MARTCVQVHSGRREGGRGGVQSDGRDGDGRARGGSGARHGRGGRAAEAQRATVAADGRGGSAVGSVQEAFVAELG